MDIKAIKNVVSVEVSELDLQETANGQLVTVDTNKGTFWVARLTMSGFHGGAHGAEKMAIWGTDFAPGDPMHMACTRKLNVGKAFEVLKGASKLETIIAHILLPVTPER